MNAATLNLVGLVLFSGIFAPPVFPRGYHGLRKSARGPSFCQIVNQAVWILDVTSRKVGFVLYYFAALLREVRFGILNILDGNFQDGSKGWPRFDKQIDILSVEANHTRILVRNFKPEFLDVKAGSLHR